MALTASSSSDTRPLFPQGCIHDERHIFELTREERNPQTGELIDVPAQVRGKRCYWCEICDRGFWR